MANKTTPVVVEDVYTAEQLAESHDFFHTSYEIVTVALRLAGKRKATISEARAIIEKFKNKKKEVK